MTKPTQKIQKDMIIQDVVLEFPETMEVFFEYGVHCVGCGNSYYETIEQGAQLHGIDADELVTDLNAVVEILQKNP